LTAEQKKQITESRRAARQQRSSTKGISEEQRAALLAKRRANDAARRNTPCAESIAMPCPDAITLPTVKLASNTHASLAREGTASPLASPSMSTPEYTIRTNGNTQYYLYSFSNIMAH
jgi:hypothetical protein